ncbi:MAG: hypothetical protein IJS79_04680 [Oscillospiraceae bacterium]|nr:hypothetical protein [Oscillospiraceae bacterium]
MDIVSSGLKLEGAQLVSYAASAAKLLKTDAVGSARGDARRLRREMGELRRLFALVRARAERGEALSGAEEWMLDNHYLIVREGKAALEMLRSCPALRFCGGESLPFALCRSLLRSGGGKLTEERLLAFLDGFQTVCVLRQSELESLGAMLRCAVVSAIGEVCRSMHRAQKPDEGRDREHAQLLSALFAALRALPLMDFGELTARVNVPGLILELDPTGEYPRMDAQTKQSYLKRLEHLAAASETDEQSLARVLIDRARREGRHVGFFLFEENRERRGELYVAGKAALTAALVLFAGYRMGPVGALLLCLPLGETVSGLADFILARLVRPRRMPRMDVRSGIPPEGKTVCVISALLSDEAAAERCAQKLERLYCACGGEKTRGELCFGLLADLRTAQEKELPDDGAVLAAAERAIEKLNEAHGGGFFLFTRPRSFDGENWSGRERKRGALCALAALVCGKASELDVCGERDALTETHFILTLDEDTEIYPGSVPELIGAAIHPLNRAVIDTETLVVTQGHGIIQPRMGVALKSAQQTDFSIIFAGAGGSDPYGALSGEPYMDAFDRGGFSGKGLIDAAALLACTQERFAGKGVLSHDAPEGAYLRGALMGDEEFFDVFPAAPAAWFRRLHRWTRGDWQNLRFAFARELPPIERARFLAKLRRSAAAPATLIALLAGFFFPARVGAAAAAAALCLLSDLILSLGGEMRRLRRRARRSVRILAGFGGGIVSNFMRLWLLPWEAWICLSAALTALWRTGVSRRRLLQWETAAQSASRGGGLGGYARAMAPVLPVGLGAMCFSTTVIGRAAGLMWLFSPVAAWALSLPAAKEKTPSAPDAAYLRAAAADTWRYFAENCTAEEHFLPPDNVQTQPPRGAAHTVSPTNLGLAMTAAVAACDLALIGDSEAAAFIGRLTDTAEAMPRYRGHFYNWYDTRTLAVLQPPFISTVDSGNLCAALLTTAAFAAEKGEEALAARLRALAEEMDFSFLYDEKRALFAICYDTLRERKAGGWYDLMASEAMLTSYLCVARGEAPRRHWRALGRACLRLDGFSGLASWSGTMFEYLMPALFLPLVRGGMLYESGRFCLYAQKRRVGVGRPWGISESAFFSLDAAGRYRYKAHGVGALALRRGMDAETVVSPYSSFLALALDGHGAAENLRRLERRGMRGAWGFYEALDLTETRTRTDDGERVCCTMAHHAGMSLCAAANALCGGSIVRRFMRDARMAAFQPLLCERVGDGGEILRRARAAEGAPVRTAPRRKNRSGGPGEKGICLLSNGSYTAALDERGELGARLDGIDVFDARFGAVTIKLRRGEEETLLMPAVPKRWEMSTETCRYEYETAFGRAALTISVGAEENGTLYELELPGQGAPCEAELAFTPLLCPLGEALDHPAFARLGIRAEERDGVLLLHRIARAGGDDCTLAVACSRPAAFRAEREGSGAVLLRPHVTVRSPIAEEDGGLRFALCLAGDAAEAARGAGQLLISGTAGRASFVGGAASLLGMRDDEFSGAMALYGAIRSFQPRQAAPLRELWKYGISGDFPLLLCRSGAREEESLLLQFCLLRSLGVGAELVITTEEAGEYPRRTHERVSAVLGRVGLEALLGERGGVHLAPIEAEETVASRAVFAAGRETITRERMPAPSLRERSGAADIPCSFDGRGGFAFSLSGALPRRPWQNILTAAGFGWIVSECGSGFLWYRNAREGRVNPPPLYPESAAGSEMLWLETPHGRFSLFAAEDGVPCRVYYSGAFARWEKKIDGKRISLTGFLDPDSGARVLLLDGARDLTVCWRMETVIGAASGAAVRCGFARGIFTAENPESFLPGMRFHAAVSAPARCRCDWAEAGMLLSFTARGGDVLVCGVCGEEEIRALSERHTALGAMRAARERFERRMGRFSLRCSDKRLEEYMNFWCLSQIYARLEARCSLYQGGGAVGFRDQLQDAVNLLLIEQKTARERILDACRHQYREGDVMHWWHPGGAADRGVRTRCSDDLLWLCWALGDYVEATGDLALCAERVDFLASPPLAEREHDRYEEAVSAGEAAAVIDHALRALMLCDARGYGEHGLPLMGAGDWNDSLSDCGGESVWLAFFLCRCARTMERLLSRLGRKEEAARCDALARRMLDAAEGCFNGRWYERAYPAHGQWSRRGERIDSIVQSWAVFCGAKHAHEALDHALCRLVDEKTGLVKLLDPPFTAGEERLGYIVSYGEGCRENGGQYTHAAVWLARACFLDGRPDAGWEILSLLLPQGRSGRYGAEPYVLPADVCSAPGHAGEAGWTWYTGSAGWYFRTVAENLLGIRKRDGALSYRPCSCALFSVSEVTVNGESLAEKGKKGLPNPAGE